MKTATESGSTPQRGAMLERILYINYYGSDEQKRSVFSVSVKSDRQYPEWAIERLHEYINRAIEDWQDYIVRNEIVENMKIKLDKQLETEVLDKPY